MTLSSSVVSLCQWTCCLMQHCHCQLFVCQLKLYNNLCSSIHMARAAAALYNIFISSSCGSDDHTFEPNHVTSAMVTSCYIISCYMISNFFVLYINSVSLVQKKGKPTWLNDLQISQLMAIRVDRKENLCSSVTWKLTIDWKKILFGVEVIHFENTITPLLTF